MAFYRRLSIIALLAVGLAVGCKKEKKPSTGPKQPQSVGLWSLAPQGAVAGVVIQDGALVTLHNWFLEGVRVADGNPATHRMLERARQEIAGGPIDPFDADSIARAGFDLNKGAALWVDAQQQIFAILPVGDRAKFVALVGGHTQNVGGTEVDMFSGGMSCAMRNNYYVCAQSTASLTQIGADGVSPLAKKAMALAPELEGQVQMVVDGPGYDLQSKIPGIEKYLTNLGTMTMAAHLGKGRLTIRSHLPGTLAERGQMLASAPSVLAGKAAGDRPSGAVRVRISPQMIAPPAGAGNEQLPGGLKVGDLFNAVTGELLALSHAGTNGSLSIQLGLASADAIRQLVQLGCSMAPSFVPGVSLEMKGDHCVGTVKLDAAPPELRSMLRERSLSVDLAVEANRLEVRLAMGKAGPVANAPGPSELGNELLAGDWNVALWGEGLSPIYFMELFNLSAVPADGRDQMKAGMWLLGHLYEAGAALGFREDGLHGVLQVTSFAAAGDELYKGYEAALAQAVNGNFAGASQAMDALAQKAPDSIVARQVGLKSGSWLGAVTLGGAVAWLTVMQGAPAPPPPPVAAPPTP